jgi:hypothetical protein
VTNRGPYSWETPTQRAGFRLGDTWLRPPRHLPPYALSRLQGPTVLRMIGDRDVTQIRTTGGAVPVSVRPLGIPFDVYLYEESAFWALSEAMDLGLPVDLWLDHPITDQWILDFAPGQTTWKPSRKPPWGVVPGVTFADRQPVALLDGAELTRVAASPPAAGEVYIPDTAGADGYFTIETPALTGTVFKLRYWPLFRVTITALEFAARDGNDAVYSVTVEEVRERSY